MGEIDAREQALSPPHQVLPSSTSQLERPRMLDVFLYGIFAFEPVGDFRFSGVSILELMRIPMVVNLGIMGALLVPLMPQSRVRAALTVLGLVCLIVYTGAVFTVALMAACAFVFASARVLRRWAVTREADSNLPLLTGWLIVHAMYIPAFFVILPPFDGRMDWGEVTQLWGGAFVVIKSLHYLRVACDGQIDPHERGAFLKFLLYMVHFASFRFGPYQTFRQFDAEVSTCRQRVSWRNRARGLMRIGIGEAKFLFILYAINLTFYYPNGYYGPFTETLYSGAPDADIGHLWFMFYLTIVRLYLFISGLSDGVIGMNLLMGIRVPENSRWPFLSRDIMEFWRRWHIQMGAFLRDEVFFRGGGLRNRWLGYFLVFSYCGLWHYPSVATILIFPSLQLAAFAATHGWTQFWERHERRKDWIHDWGNRLYLHNSLPTQIAGMIIVINIVALNCLLVLDHQHGGALMLRRMLGW